MDFEGYEESFAVRGKVVRADASGFGIQFLFEDDHVRDDFGERLRHPKETPGFGK
jgi:hypothetical protein